MNASQLAIIVHGALALILLTLFAVFRSAEVAFALVVAASGMTYVFQTLDNVDLTAFGEAVASYMFFLVWALYCAAFIAAVIGA